MLEGPRRAPEHGPASRSAYFAAVLDSLPACGFHSFLLANDCQEHRYPDAVLQPSWPVLLRAGYMGLKDLSDLVFSRTDVDYLP
ncbi:hypothetical protein GCM10010172_30370 [Paractinoplanes ferrugineus]|uniref:Uncharacterized protein n=1 Tax=Paractinoplanes ferrugineus TaxID=113564 RepID=A0A919JBS9_9ACTN|nr:hypothetical protein Afe05nite_61110 [Actinoplanes ferrugineus]